MRAEVLEVYRRRRHGGSPPDRRGGGPSPALLQLALRDLEDSGSSSSPAVAVGSHRSQQTWRRTRGPPPIVTDAPPCAVVRLPSPPAAGLRRATVGRRRDGRPAAPPRGHGEQSPSPDARGSGAGPET